MGLFKRGSFAAIIQRIFGKKHAKIGIYGPPNVGKTTLANRILRDWTGDIMGSVSDVPHETRRAKWKKNVKVENGSSSLFMDIVDTPGIATKVDYKEFMNTYGLNKEESKFINYSSLVILFKRRESILITILKVYFLPQ